MLEVVAWLLERVVFVFASVTGKSFPEKLSDREEKEYIALMGKGDSEAREKLIEHNQRLVAHIAKKYMNSGKESEDLISIGMIGLIKGVTTFKPDKGCQIGTYCAKCIDNEILMSIRSMKKQRNEVSISEPIGTDREGNEMSLLDILGTHNDAVLEEVELALQSQKLFDLIDRILSGRERRVIEFRYGLRGAGVLTQREIAKELNISRSYISRIEKKAIQKLRDEMGRA